MKVNWVQVMFLYLSVRIAFDLVNVLPISAAPTPNRDVWLSPVLAVPVAWAVGAVVVKLGRFLPGETLIQHSRTLFGPVIGFVVALLYLWWFVFFAAVGLRVSTDFFLSSFMIYTPVSVLMISVMLPAVIAARRGLSTIALANQVMGPAILVLVWLIILLSANRLHPANLTPVLAGGMRNLLANSLTPMAIFSDIVNLGMIIPYMSKSSDAGKVVKWGIPISAFHVAAITAVALASLGVESAALSEYPGLTVARRIQVGEFIQRVEPALMAVWLGGVFVQVALNLLWAAQAVTQGCGLGRYEVAVLPLAVIIVTVAFMLGENNLEYTVLFHPRFMGPFSAVFVLVIPLTLLFVAYAKKAEPKLPVPQESVCER